MFLLKLGSELQNLVKKILIRYEDINKIWTKFPQSGKFPRSGMHRGANSCQMFTKYRDLAFDIGANFEKY